MYQPLVLKHVFQNGFEGSLISVAGQLHVGKLGVVSDIGDDKVGQDEHGQREAGGDQKNLCTDARVMR
jgi:hypothetical protein